ncbi:MAG: hypothetical protein QM696_00025 [Steroidobacteraceae bacterium]
MIRSGFVSLLLGALLALPAAAAEPTLAGLWRLTIASPQGTRTPSMQLAQDGSDVSGTYKSARGEAPISGRLTGNQFELTVRLGNGDNAFTVQYRGQIQGDAMQGTVLMGSRGEVAFTGERER